MPSKVIEIIAKGKDEVSAALGDASSSVASLGSAAAGIAAGGLAIAATAVAALGAASLAAASELADLTVAAGKVEGTRETFATLTAEMGSYDEVIQAAREATRGMVTDTELWTGASKILGMEIADTEEGLLDHLEAATQLGTAYGDNETAIENWALMMANQSLRRMDSFGMSSSIARERMEELTNETEGLTREQAFNIAVMEQAEVAMARVGEQGDGVTASLARWTATQENLKNQAGRAFIPVLNAVMDTMNPLLDKYGPVLIGILEEWGMWLGSELPGFIERFKGLLEILGVALGQLATALGINVGEMDATQAIVSVVTFTVDILTAGIQVLTIGIIGAKNAVEWIKDKFDGLVSTLRGVVDRIREVRDWIWSLKDSFNSLSLPDWLTPGSPTPLETGLLGIERAFAKLPSFQVAASGGLGGSAPMPITVVNHFGPGSVRNDQDILRVADAITRSMEIRGVRRAM
ncbi:MAG: hypothetical protein SXV54_13930 [Chloroflexota bacterium]|nr:hypothetical protein [Chloroflexota bacterium]